MNAAQRREWREYVYGCSELTPGARLVLLALADYADWPDGTNARPGIKRLAEMCGFKSSAVEKALAKGRELKLIDQTGRANPKRGWAAVYRLLPASVSTHTTVRVEDGFNPYETEVQPVRDEFQPVRDDVSTHTYVQPTKPSTPSQDTEREGQAACAASLPDRFSDDEQIIDAEIVDEAEQEPSPYCRAHRKSGYGSSDPCRGCKIARLAHERWQRVNLERLIASNGGLFGMGGESSAMKPEDCRRCDGRWVLGPDGEPLEPMVKCRHEGADDVA